MNLQENTWFVKTDGKLRGPFGADVIRSMAERGRLVRQSELSIDRRSWISASDFTELFPSQELPIEHELGPTENTSDQRSSDQTQYFFNDRGLESGPVSLDRLQQLVSSGKIRRKDLVWHEGVASWFPAAQLKQLEFPKTKAATVWVKKNPYVVGVAVTGLLVAVGFPAWYVVSLNIQRNHMIEQARQRELLEDQRQHEIGLAKISDEHNKAQMDHERNLAEIDAQAMRDLANSQPSHGSHKETIVRRGGVKTCPRCGGDGDRGFLEYVRCIYCGGDGEVAEDR